MQKEYDKLEKKINKIGSSKNHFIRLPYAYIFV